MKKGFLAAVMIGAALIAVIGWQEAAPKSYAGAVHFKDTELHWAKPGIEQAVERGYVDGYEDGTFRPDYSISRAEFVKLAVTAMKLNPGVPAPGSDWYDIYVNAAVSAGLHKYEDFTSGDWNTPITRLEMARIAVRAADRSVQENKDGLTDEELFYKATKLGLIQGFAAGALGKGEATTRAQSVTVIERILTVEGGGSLPVDQAAMSYAEVDWHGTNGEAMLGESFIDFPQKLDASDDVDVIIDKAIVVDMTQNDGAYRSWFPSLLKSYNGEVYVLALHLTETNKKAEPGANFALRQLVKFGPEGSGLHFENAAVPKQFFNNGQTPIYHLAGMDRSTLVAQVGWLIYVAPKYQIDELIQSKRKLSIYMAYSKYTVQADHRLYFTQE